MGRVWATEALETIRRKTQAGARKIKCVHLAHICNVLGVSSILSKMFIYIHPIHIMDSLDVHINILLARYIKPGSVLQNTQIDINLAKTLKCIRFSNQKRKNWLV